jgi:hypothetical protein
MRAARLPRVMLASFFGEARNEVEGIDWGDVAFGIQLPASNSRSERATWR